MDKEEKRLREMAAHEDESFVSVAPSPELKAALHITAEEELPSAKTPLVVSEFTSRPPGFYHGAD